MILAENILRSSLLKATNFLKRKIQDELRAQGHVATGRGVNDIDIVISPTQDGFKTEIRMQDYLLIVDKGVPASRVPFGGRTGRGSTSRYIEALIEWIGIIRPSLAEAEARSFAFAIANKAKQEGHPTRGSFAFSSNGRRKEWARFAVDQNLDEFEVLLDLGHFVAVTFENFVTDIQNTVVG